MKCAECSSLNPPRSTVCLNCGASLVVQRTEIANEAIPEWRKEVTRKAREYGERKKTLTTPPNPLKTSVRVAAPEQEPANYYHRPERPVSPVIPEPEKTAAAPPPEPVKIPEPVEPLKLNRIEPVQEEVSTDFEPQMDPDPVQPQAPPVLSRLESLIPSSPSRPVFPPIKPHQEFERVELEQSTDFLPFDEEEEHESPGLMLIPRSVSFVIDNLVFAGAIYLVIFICKQFDIDIIARFQTSWLPLISIILALHCIYYVYFYKTSRQTPGQVFFALEVRDLSAGTISLGKAIGRWAALVFLNIFNFVPLFSGRNFLLLDYLSGTEVRSLKYC